MKTPKLTFPKFKVPTLRLPKIKTNFSFFKAKGLARPKYIFVLEIGEEWLKMAAVQEIRHARQIVEIGAELIKDANDLEVSLKVTAFLKALNFKPSSVIVSHPAHHLTVRILQLPSLDPKEIADIVELQAVKQTPHAREEITAGFYILESDKAGYSHVLVAISRRDIAARYSRIVEMAGLPIPRITLSLEGSWNWFESVAAGEKQETGEALLLLDLDVASTDLMILSQAKPVFTRSLDFGVRNLTAGGAVIESEFVKEVQRSLELGESDLKDKKITRIILTGGGNKLKDLAALLSRENNLPSEVIAPFSGETAKRTAHPENPLCTSSEVSFVPVAGLALGEESTSINLTPPEIQIRKSLEDQARDLAFLGTLLLALASLLSLVSFGKIYKKNSYLERLKKDYAAIHKQSGEVEKLVAKMKLASEQMAAGGGFLDVLQETSEVMPENITLTGLQYNSQDKTVVLRGVSAEMSAVFQFLTTLEGVPHLESVKTRNVTKRKLADREVAEFEMVASIVQAPPPTLPPGPAKEKDARKTNAA